MKCIVTDNKCMTIPAPKPAVVCNPPSGDILARNFDVNRLEGSWYIVLGKNKIYDCFDCQNTTFYNSNEGYLYAYNYLRHETQIDRVRQWNESTSTSGILKYESTQMGHDTISEWRILDSGPDYFFTYYCGSVAEKYFYEGSVVYSKKKELSRKNLSRIQKVAASVGYDINAYCKMSFDKCQDI